MVKKDEILKLFRRHSGADYPEESKELQVKGVKEDRPFQHYNFHFNEEGDFYKDSPLQVEQDGSSYSVEIPDINGELREGEWENPGPGE